MGDFLRFKNQPCAELYEMALGAFILELDKMYLTFSNNGRSENATNAHYPQMKVINGTAWYVISVAFCLALYLT